MRVNVIPSQLGTVLSRTKTTSMFFLKFYATFLLSELIHPEIFLRKFGKIKYIQAVTVPTLYICLIKRYRYSCDNEMPSTFF